MAGRAIWKGVVKAGTQSIPVKLYSAVQERTVHFRLLHKTDHAPVKQQLVSAETDEVIEYGSEARSLSLCASEPLSHQKYATITLRGDLT